MNLQHADHDGLPLQAPLQRGRRYFDTSFSTATAKPITKPAASKAVAASSSGPCEPVQVFETIEDARAHAQALIEDFHAAAKVNKNTINGSSGVEAILWRCNQRNNGGCKFGVKYVVDEDGK